MKRHAYVLSGALGVASLIASGCAIDSPAEWQIAVGTLLINAFHQGSVTLAIERLDELHAQQVIDGEEYDYYKALLLSEPMVLQEIVKTQKAVQEHAQNEK